MKVGSTPGLKSILRVVSHLASSHATPGFFWLDEQLIVIEHSEQVRSLLALAGKLRGREITDLIEELIGLEGRLRMIALRKKGKVRLEFINRAPVGWEPDYLTIRAEPAIMGFKGLVLFVEEANESGRLMQELAHQRNELTLKEEELKQANRELAKANRMKGLMSAIASHEIGNRLTHIIGFGSILLEQAHLSNYHREMLQRMLQAANHLAMTMNQIIRLDQLERGDLQKSSAKIDGNKILRDSLDTFLIPEKNRFELRVSIPEEACYISCDEIYLQQIIFNLLSNAIKYTPEGGLISIRAGRGDRIWSFLVENSGPGIPLDEQEKIFQPYSRLDETVLGQVPGTGLGLFISRAIVQAYGGNIELISSPKSKTSFRVDLPVASL